MTGNSAVTGGGGAAESGLINSIVYYNSATSGEQNAGACRGDNSCTTDYLPPYYGVRNITNAPLFINAAGGNLRLQANSPCINSGRNADAAGPTDFDGNPRIRGGTVDVGAYEFQTPSSVLSYAWAQKYGLPTNGSADFTDADGDRMNNWQEWRADTIPTNALSFFANAGDYCQCIRREVTWESFNTRNYWLERATNLGMPLFSIIASNLLGQVNTTTFTDTNAIGSGPFFYRVGVQP